MHYVYNLTTPCVLVKFSPYLMTHTAEGLGLLFVKNSVACLGVASIDQITRITGFSSEKEDFGVRKKPSWISVLKEMGVN